MLFHPAAAYFQPPPTYVQDAGFHSVQPCHSCLPCPYFLALLRHAASSTRSASYARRAALSRALRQFKSWRSPRIHASYLCSSPAPVCFSAACRSRATKLFRRASSRECLLRCSVLSGTPSFQRHPSASIDTRRSTKLPASGERVVPDGVHARLVAMRNRQVVTRSRNVTCGPGKRAGTTSCARSSACSRCTHHAKRKLPECRAIALQQELKMSSHLRPFTSN